MNFHAVDMKRHCIWRWTWALGKDYPTYYIAPMIQSPEKGYLC